MPYASCFLTCRDGQRRINRALQSLLYGRAAHCALGRRANLTSDDDGVTPVPPRPRSMYACRDAARSQRLLAANVVRQLIRMNERYCRRALAAWQSAVQAQREKRAMLHGAIQRMALAKLRASWHAWVEHVSMKLTVRQHHSAVITKVWSAHLLLTVRPYSEPLLRMKRGPVLSMSMLKVLSSLHAAFTSRY